MMESQILRTLRFEIGTSTSYTFATRFLRFANADDRVRHLTYVYDQLSDSVFVVTLPLIS